MSKEKELHFTTELNNLFIDKGVHLNEKDVIALLERGADPEFVNIYGYSFKDRAIMLAREDIVSVIRHYVLEKFELAILEQLGDRQIILKGRSQRKTEEESSDKS